MDTALISLEALAKCFLGSSMSALNREKPFNTFGKTRIEAFGKSHIRFPARPVDSRRRADTPAKSAWEKVIERLVSDNALIRNEEGSHESH